MCYGCYRWGGWGALGSELGVMCLHCHGSGSSAIAALRDVAQAHCTYQTCIVRAMSQMLLLHSLACRVVQLGDEAAAAAKQAAADQTARRRAEEAAEAAQRESGSLRDSLAEVVAAEARLKQQLEGAQVRWNGVGIVDISRVTSWGRAGLQLTLILLQRSCHQVRLHSFSHQMLVAAGAH